MRYPWWERLESLRGRSLPQRRAEIAVEIGAQFISEYAEDAERDGWQPIHILKPFSGLAWRWPHLPNVATRRGLLAATFKPFDFVYAAGRAGMVTHLTADRRHRALMTFGLPGEYSQ